MKLFHRTPAAETILRQGFRDAAGYYVTDRLHEGVWLSTVPPDATDDAWGTDLLEVDIPEADVAPHEWIEAGNPYREFVVPAAIVNRFPVRHIAQEEEDARFVPIEEWWRDHAGSLCLVRRYADGHVTGQVVPLDDGGVRFETTSQSVSNVQPLVDEALEKAGTSALTSAGTRGRAGRDGEGGPVDGLG